MWDQGFLLLICLPKLVQGGIILIGMEFCRICLAKPIPVLRSTKLQNLTSLIFLKKIQITMGNLHTIPVLELSQRQCQLSKVLVLPRSLFWIADILDGLLSPTTPLPMASPARHITNPHSPLTTILHFEISTARQLEWTQSIPNCSTLTWKIPGSSFLELKKRSHTPAPRPFSNSAMISL